MIIRHKPIILSDDIVAVIHLFKRDHNNIDPDPDDIEWMEERYDQYIESAKEFVRQLKGHWNVLFMESLIKEAFSEMRVDTGAFDKKEQQKLIEELIKIKDNIS